MLLGGVRRRSAEEEGESVFVSMTDLTVSFLFIILILLAFFATQLKPDEMVPLDRYEAMDRHLSELRTELAAAHERIRELESSLSNARRKTDALEREKQALDTRLSDAVRTVASLRASIDGLRRSLAEVLATHQTLLARVENLERELDGTRIERHAALQRVAALQSEVFELRRSLAHYRLAFGLLSERIVDLGNPGQLAAYLKEVSRSRDALLERVTEHIRREFPGIRVTVHTEAGVIRFRGEDLFESGQWRIDPDSTVDRVSRAIAEAFADELPCYTLGSRSTFDVKCNNAFALVETIQVEGHTDDVPLGTAIKKRENMEDNYDLSARRGAETMRSIFRHRPEIRDFRNRGEQPVLSFAGYGADRPIRRDSQEKNNAANRRIDIRFILDTPRDPGEVTEIRNRLTRERPGLPPAANEEVQ